MHSRESWLHGRRGMGSASHPCACVSADTAGFRTRTHLRAIRDCAAGLLAVAADHRAGVAHIAMPCRSAGQERARGVADRGTVDKRLEMPRLGEGASTLDRMRQRQPAGVPAGVAGISAGVHGGGHVVLHRRARIHQSEPPHLLNDKGIARPAPSRVGRHHGRCADASYTIARRSHAS